MFYCGKRYFMVFSVSICIIWIGVGKLLDDSIYCNFGCNCDWFEY